METVSISLSTETLDRIQRYSTRPLLETPEIVLNRILDLVESNYPPEHRAAAPRAERPALMYFTTSRGVKLPIGLELWASYRGTNPKAEVTTES